jgi:chemotaxis signal transduction protein
MTAARNTSLLRLQQGLMNPESAVLGGEQRDLLPFEASLARWSLPCAEVVRVMMPADIISLAGYSQLPECVIGVVAADSEMLSVVDAGLLLGQRRTHLSLKSRLIVCGEGALKGFALLVDRVFDRVSSAEPDKGLNRTDADRLHSLLMQSSPTRRDSR